MRFEPYKLKASTVSIIRYVVASFLYAIFVKNTLIFFFLFPYSTKSAIIINCQKCEKH